MTMPEEMNTRDARIYHSVLNESPYSSGISFTQISFFENENLLIEIHSLTQATPFSQSYSTSWLFRFSLGECDDLTGTPPVRENGTLFWLQTSTVVSYKSCESVRVLLQR